MLCGILIDHWAAAQGFRCRRFGAQGLAAAQGFDAAQGFARRRFGAQGLLAVQGFAAQGLLRLRFGAQGLAAAHGLAARLRGAQGFAWATRRGSEAWPAATLPRASATAGRARASIFRPGLSCLIVVS